MRSFGGLHDLADANEYVDATGNGNDKDDVTAGHRTAAPVAAGRRAEIVNTVRVRETIDHGDFHAVTTAEAESLTSAIKAVLSKSPYPTSHLHDDAWLTKLWDELLNDGTAMRGWCRYAWEWLD